jgi:acetylornithine/succinyldiaminopimelate/putrescine aminotransferase
MYEEDAAAIIMEPVQREGGFIVPDVSALITPKDVERSLQWIDEAKKGRGTVR